MYMLKTERQTDSRAEKIIGEFLDKNLYAQIRVSTGVIFDRITNKTQQIQGIDVAIHKNNIYIDEKVQLDYINKNLPTNCFEISFIGTDGIEKTGWFVDENLLTTHYLIVWPFTHMLEIDKFKLQSYDISKLQCILISKKRLHLFLSYHGFSNEILSKTANEMRKNNTKKFQPKGKPFYFVFTQSKSELPVNIVIKKEILLKLSSHVYEVASEKLTTLSKDAIENTIHTLQSCQKYRY